MKSCQVCGETYSNHVDFCFDDGDVLVAQASVFDVPEPKIMAAQGAQVSLRTNAPAADPTTGDLDVPLTGEYTASAIAGVAQGEDSLAAVPPLSPSSGSEVSATGSMPTSITTGPVTEIPPADAAPADSAPTDADVDTRVPKAPDVENAPLEDPSTQVYQRPENTPNDPEWPPESQISTATPLHSQPRIHEPEQPQDSSNRKVIFAMFAMVALLLSVVGVVFFSGLLSSGAQNPPPQIFAPKVADGARPAPAANGVPVTETPVLEAAPDPEPVAPEPVAPEPVAPEPVAPEPEPEPVTAAGNDGVAVVEVEPEAQTVTDNAAEVTVPTASLTPPAGTSQATPEREPDVVEAPAPTASARIGAIMVFYAGRSGDQLLIDGTPAGPLPVRSELAEGNHSFTVTGAVGEVKVSKMITLKPEGQITLIHLK
ncbi:MAG: hypothetical protein GWP91_21455 [Rhodobacterales bacterium]|nr:hypothetical protein [Rhodobacterales bacterium]